MKRLVLILLLYLICSSIDAQTNYFNEKSIGEKLLNDGIIFLKDGAGFFTYPISMDKNAWLTFGGISAGTYGLMYLDQSAKNLIGRETNNTLNGDFWDIPTRYGIIGYANIASLTTYAAGIVSGSNEIRRVGRMMFQSLSYSGLTVMAVRIIFGRERPYSNKGPWAFSWFSLDNEVQSFPSGHTTVAFAMSTVLAEYFNTIWARIGFYGLASLTAYARVLNNQHWLSDVIFGALIGIAGGVYTVNKEYGRGFLGKNVSLNLNFNTVSIQYKF